jgi:hypothetical protein
MGIGYGKCALLYVGGIFNRSEFFTVGESHVWALKSEGCALGGGEIIVAESAFKFCKSKNKNERLYEYEKIKNKIKDSKGNYTGVVEKFYKIIRLKGHGVKPSAEAAKIVKSISPAMFK